MNYAITAHSIWGRTLFVDNGAVCLGIPLDFGIRISYLTYKGSENLFFEQPNDMTDITTPDGWRVRGGHRLWTAPESEKVYYPDNDPIAYEIKGETLILKQKADPWLNVEKCMEITFAGENEVEILHRITNVSDKDMTFAVWPVTSVAPGGKEYIPLNKEQKGMFPTNTISAWSFTNIGDERVKFSKDAIEITHTPLEENFKIGVGHPAGYITYTNKGVVFEKILDIKKDAQYTDGNVSYETYMCKHMLELETLSPLGTAVPGGSLEHKEHWKLTKIS